MGLSVIDKLHYEHGIRVMVVLPNSMANSATTTTEKDIAYVVNTL